MCSKFKNEVATAERNLRGSKHSKSIIFHNANSALVIVYGVFATYVEYSAYVLLWQQELSPVIISAGSSQLKYYPAANVRASRGCKSKVISPKGTLSVNAEIVPATMYILGEIVVCGKETNTQKFSISVFRYKKGRHTAQLEVELNANLFFVPVVYNPAKSCR